MVIPGYLASRGAEPTAEIAGGLTELEYTPSGVGTLCSRSVPWRGLSCPLPCQVRFWGGLARSFFPSTERERVLLFFRDYGGPPTG